MDPSGRFNFWRMLLHTRAVTPPRVPPNHWSRAVILWRPGRWLLLLMMVLAAALAVRLSVNNQPTLSAAIGPPSPVAQTSWAPTLPWCGLPTGKPGQLAAMRTSSKILESRRFVMLLLRHLHSTAYDVVRRAIVSQRATVSLPRQAVIVRKQHHHARW